MKFNFRKTPETGYESRIRDTGPTKGAHKKRLSIA